MDLKSSVSQKLISLAGTVDKWVAADVEKRAFGVRSWQPHMPVTLKLKFIHSSVTKEKDDEEITGKQSEFSKI